MRYGLNIYKVRARLLMSAVILLAACSDDTDRSDSLPDDSDVLRIAAYTQDMTSPSQPAMTRAVSIPSGYSRYDGSASIGVFMTPKTTEMTLISYEDNAWHSMVKVTPETQYYIYGYMPAYATCAISDISQNNGFKDGAVLTFNNVPSVMSEDFSVITGVLQLQPDNAVPPQPVDDGTLKAGTFAYTGQASGKNFVDLMFDHLYGALNISLKVAPSYDALRTIKLKELRLRTSVNGTPSKSKTNVTVTLNKTAGETPISNVVYEPTGEDVGDLSFFQSATGKLLRTDYESFMGHFMPKGITTFIVTSVYDVYDKNVTEDHPDGNLIRKDCTAENTLEISELYDRQLETMRGYKYTIKLTVMPTYLYILSDPDLDNPTAVVSD